MSYCKEVGKDRIIFITKEEHETPSTVELPPIDPNDTPRGLIMPNGDINWNCPCLGGMASGPCGFQFREAFSCFHYSENEPKGGECVDKFVAMQECMTNYPNLYPNHKDDDDDDDDDDDEKTKDLVAAAFSSAEDAEFGQEKMTTTKDVDKTTTDNKKDE